MKKVLFVCHGNICRSPMAEFLFKDYVKKIGVENDFYIESCATSREEIGNEVHYGTRKILNSLGIDCSKKTARQITKQDLIDFDYIICMDANNVRNLERVVGYSSKVSMLLDYPKLFRDVLDPWYTGDFNATYNDIMIGIKAFYEYVK